MNKRQSKIELVRKYIKNINVNGAAYTYLTIPKDIANNAIIQSNNVIMQNTDTTLFSFQPDNSKWWCKGAIFNNLFPPVFLKYATCNTTDKVSNTGIAAIINSINGIFRYKAIADITPAK